MVWGLTKRIVSWIIVVISSQIRTVWGGVGRLSRPQDHWAGGCTCALTDGCSVLQERLAIRRVLLQDPEALEKAKAGPAPPADALFAGQLLLSSSPTVGVGELHVFPLAAHVGFML